MNPYAARGTLVNARVGHQLYPQAPMGGGMTYRGSLAAHEDASRSAGDVPPTSSAVAAASCPAPTMSGGECTARPMAATGFCSGHSQRIAKGLAILLGS